MKNIILFKYSRFWRLNQFPWEKFQKKFLLFKNWVLWYKNYPVHNIHDTDKFKMKLNITKYVICYLCYVTDNDCL